MNAYRRNKKIVLTLLVVLIIVSTISIRQVWAMPFYNLKPAGELVLRARFYTTYSSSSDERKHNIKKASESINKTLLDVGEEFSFNHVVGERTVARGYKTAKIIVGGDFVDGIGGGVCQVSTTLYNAVLLAGLDVLEYHPHSLQVGYVAPSFDAMVSGGGADLRFVNNTDNPIIVYSEADGNRLLVSIYGQPMDYVIERKSVIIGEIQPPEEMVVKDEKGEFPELFEGEQKVVRYEKKGLLSEGYLIKKVNGKTVSEKRVRRDKYKPIGKLIVEGTIKRSEDLLDDWLGEVGKI
ncbi:MAG: hypothetical protein E7362_01245 [Clostridiales bacterium]|nr:hypothetical protein [Clostridiales bacterium]